MEFGLLLSVLQHTWELICTMKDQITLYKQFLWLDNATLTTNFTKKPTIKIAFVLFASLTVIIANGDKRFLLNQPAFERFMEVLINYLCV